MTDIPLSPDEWLDVAIAARMYVDAAKRSNQDAIAACEYLDRERGLTEKDGSVWTRADLYGHRHEGRRLAALSETVNTATVEISQRCHAKPISDVHSNGNVHQPVNIADPVSHAYSRNDLWTVEARTASQGWTSWASWVDRATAEAEKQHAMDEGFAARIVRPS